MTFDHFTNFLQLNYLFRQTSGDNPGTFVIFLLCKIVEISQNLETSYWKLTHLVLSFQHEQGCQLVYSVNFFCGWILLQVNAIDIELLEKKIC